MAKNKQWSDDDVRDLQSLLFAGKTQADIAKTLGRTPKSVARKIEGMGLTRKPKTVAHTEYREDKEAATEAHWKSQYETLHRKYKTALKDAALTEKLVDDIKELAPKSYSANPVASRSRKKSSSQPQSAMLLFSDTHLGKVTLREQTLGFSEYNFDVFLARLKYVEESVISIMKDHVNTEVPELVIAMLGDMLDGALNHGVEGGLRNTVFTQFYAGGHAIAQFFRNIARHVPKIRIETVVGNHCVDEETEILTRAGWKTVDQLSGDEECLGLSKDGHSCAWQPVNEVVREVAVDRMVSVKNRCFSFSGTEHHRFYYWVPGHPMLNEARWSELPTNADRFRIAIPTAAQIEQPGRPDMRPYLALAGAVLTDGSIAGDQNRVTVYQTKDPQWVVDAFEASGLDYYTNSRERAYPEQIGGVKLTSTGTCIERSFGLSAKASREFLGVTGLEKGKIPAWAWELNHEEFMIFFGAILNGDGAELDTGSPCLSAKSYEFASQLQGLLALHGITSNVSPYQPKASKNPQWRLNISYRAAVPVGGSAKITYSEPTGNVWCVRTGSENFFCRRDGKAYFTGNTRWTSQRRMPTENRFSNFDMVLYAFVEALTSDVKNIHWNLNQQPFQIFDVQGFTFFAAHGDHLRGGDKALGIPNHAFGRQISTTSQLFAKNASKAPNFYVSGHLHRSITLPHALGDVMVNGGFPGLDNYALSENFSPVDPTQRFFFVHPKYGRTASYELGLKHAVQNEERPYVIPGAFPIE